MKEIQLPKGVICTSITRDGKSWQLVYLQSEDLDKPVNAYGLDWLGNRLIISEKANDIVNYVKPQKVNITHHGKSK